MYLRSYVTQQVLLLIKLVRVTLILDISNWLNKLRWLLVHIEIRWIDLALTIHDIVHRWNTLMMLLQSRLIHKPWIQINVGLHILNSRLTILLVCVKLVCIELVCLLFHHIILLVCSIIILVRLLHTIIRCALHWTQRLKIM